MVGSAFCATRLEFFRKGETMTLVPEPAAGNPPVRFDEREVGTEHGMRLVELTGNPDTKLCRSRNLARRTSDFLRGV